MAQTPHEPSRSRTGPARTVLHAAALLAVLATGCADEAPTERSTGAEPSAASGTSAADLPDPASPATGGDPPTTAVTGTVETDDSGPVGSPIDELFGSTSSSPTEQRRNALLVEQLTADCMRREGWEYIPVDYLTRSASTQDPDIALQVSDPDEFGRLHGYGVVYGYVQFEEPALLGEVEPTGDRDLTIDPNAGYVASLTDGERLEYERSLYGSELADAMEGGASPGDVLPMIGSDGCMAEAYDEVYALNPATNEPDVRARLEEYRAQMPNSPELQAAYADWRDCMGDDADVLDQLGRPVDRPDQMWGYVDGLKNDALGLEPVAITSEDAANPSGQYADVWLGADGSGIGWIGTPAPIAAEELDRLLTTELGLWQQDHACQIEADVAAITAEVEQRIVDSLVEQFPQLADS